MGNISVHSMKDGLLLLPGQDSGLDMYGRMQGAWLQCKMYLKVIFNYPYYLFSWGGDT